MDLHTFVFRGLLAEDAIDKAGRKKRHRIESEQLKKIRNQLGYDDMDPMLVENAESMAVVYTAFHAFENSVRKFISQKLIEEVGSDWWETCVGPSVKTRATSRQESEQAAKWHSVRGGDPIDYVDLGDLVSIIANNFSYFEAHMENAEWAKQIITTVERSRNVIMHSGKLDPMDIERVGIMMKMWVSQVGA